MVMERLPKVLVFDWDNTLVDSWVTIHRALERTFLAMGRRPWTLEEAKRRVRASARDAFPKLFGERAEEATRIFYQSYEEDHLEVLRPLPDAEKLISAITANGGIFLSVLSNKQGHLLRQEVTHLGWQDHFGAVVGAQDAERDKPASEALLASLAGSDARPGSGVWVVGDTDIDMACAAANGCEAVLLRPHEAEEGEFGAFNPGLWMPDCGAFLAHLRALGLAEKSHAGGV
jgi:phosphoglycolate phosphatase